MLWQTIKFDWRFRNFRNLKTKITYDQKTTKTKQKDN